MTRCQADVTRPVQHSARKLAASAAIALPSIFVPVSPRPDHRTLMIPSTAVADSEKMTRRSRTFRVGNFTGITSSAEFLLPTLRTAELPHLSRPTQLQPLSYLPLGRRCSVPTARTCAYWGFDIAASPGSAARPGL